MSSLSKKIIIYICSIVLIFGTGFLSGRYIRLRGAKQSGTNLVNGLEQQSEGISKISDDNIIIGDGLSVIGQRNDQILAELGECKNRIGQLESIVNEFTGAIDSCDENFRRFETEQELYYGTMEYLLGYAKAKAEQDERIVSAARELYREYRGCTDIE